MYDASKPLKRAPFPVEENRQNQYARDGSEALVVCICVGLDMGVHSKGHELICSGSAVLTPEQSVGIGSVLSSPLPHRKGKTSER